MHFILQVAHIIEKGLVNLKGPTFFILHTCKYCDKFRIIIGISKLSWSNLSYSLQILPYNLFHTNHQNELLTIN